MDEEEDASFIPLSAEEMSEFAAMVWASCANGEINQAQAANMLLHEAWVNGQIEA